MKQFTGVNDPVFEPKSKYSALERFFLKMIRDERDLPFIKLCLFLLFTIIPSAVLMYLHIVPGYWWYLHFLVHTILIVPNMGPFTLMLHNTSHRPFFKSEYGFFNGIIPWIIGPFMGQSPLLYYSHHIGMHHSEGNMPEDKSSTMPYQRDSLGGFFHYWFSFLTIGIVQLVEYFSTKNKKTRRHFQLMSIRGEALFFAFCIAMCFLDWQSTLMVFIAPVVAIRTAMMMGNWAQHAFVDQDEPENDYKNSITCINSFYNKTCFNDGYHIGHHANPNMHWTDMPGDFLKNQQKYIDNNAIVFEGIDYNQIWFYLMTKRYDTLAKHFVNLGNRFSSDAEIIALLKARTKQFEIGKFSQSAS